MQNSFDVIVQIANHKKKLNRAFHRMWKIFSDSQILVKSSFQI